MVKIRKIRESRMRSKTDGEIIYPVTASKAVKHKDITVEQYLDELHAEQVFFNILKGEDHYVNKVVFDADDLGNMRKSVPDAFNNSAFYLANNATDKDEIHKYISFSQSDTFQTTCCVIETGDLGNAGVSVFIDNGVLCPLPSNSIGLYIKCWNTNVGYKYAYITNVKEAIEFFANAIDQQRLMQDVVRLLTLFEYLPSNVSPSNKLVAQDAVNDINSKIPNQASSTNQLADKDFVNSTVQTGTANFRGNWDRWISVSSDASDYPADYASNTTPTVNDYLVVQDASDKPYVGEMFQGKQTFDIYIDPETGEETPTIPGMGQKHSTQFIKVDADTTLNIVFPDATWGGVISEYVAIHFYYQSKTWIECSKEISIPYMTQMSDYNDTVVVPQNAYYMKVVFFVGSDISIQGPSYLEGTWRFKYSGDWSIAGKNGWLPEYRVNEAPFTAEQLKVLDSRITRVLVDKLNSLPSNPAVISDTSTTSEYTWSAAKIIEYVSQIYIRDYTEDNNNEEE